MEKQAGVSGGSFRLLGIVPRIAAIVSARIITPYDSIVTSKLFPMQVLAVIVIGVSAATIGIIEDNDFLELVRDTDRLVGDAKDLQDLINQSLGAAGWLIALGFGVLVGEVVAIILTILIFSQSLKLVLQIIVRGILHLLLNNSSKHNTVFLATGHTIQCCSGNLL